MNTTIYLIRHSIPFNEHKGIKLIQESLLIQNEKTPLSITGEENASKYFTNEEFKNIDTVWSSNYVRAYSTAKYLASYNNLKVNIDERFNERIHGIISSYEELPDNFELMQFNNENYKLNNGESKKEVQLRMQEGINNILNNYKGKRIAIISHATAITYYLDLYCDIKLNKYFNFKNKTFFDGNFDYLETFKLTFNYKNELISIDNNYNKNINI